MALLKSGQKLSSTPTKTRSLSSGFNLTTGKQGKFNQEDYDAFIRSMKTEKATSKKATSSLPSKKKKTKEERYGELLQIDENLTKSKARKNLLKAESEVKSKQSKYNKLLGKEREKQGVEMNVTFEKPDKKDLLTKDKQLVTEKSKKQQLEENAKKISKSEQNLLATKKGKKAQKDVREARNKKAIAQYQYDVKKSEGEKTTFADKTIMTPVRAAKDFFSSLTDTENKYVSDSGEEYFLPSYNQMKQEKVQEDMSGIGKFLNTIGYEGTKLGLSAALDAISGGIAGKALYTTDIFTDSYKDAMNKTNNQTAAMSTAGIKSGLDLILDLAAGGALKAAGNIGSKISGKAVAKTATRDLATRIGDKVFEKTGSKILSRFVGTGATEALQEGTEQYLESLSDIIFLGSDEQGNKSVGEMFVKDGKLNTKMLESAAYAASVGFLTGGGFGVMGASDPQTREMRSLMAFRSELNEQSKTSNEYKPALTQVNDIIQARNKIDSISPYKINKNTVEINGKTIDAKEVKSRLAKIDNMLREGEITDIDTLQRVDNAWRTLNAIDNEITANETIKEKSRSIESNIKEKQFEIIKNNNPMEDDYHTGIRSTDDIKTANEVFTKENFEEVSNPDFTFEDAQKALETGKVAVYSSKPIENGSFVSTSKMEAESYSGNGKVYTKEVPLDNVAWIENTQGQYTDLSKSQSTQAETKKDETIDEKSVQIKQEEKPTNISETEEVFNRYHKDASNISDKYDYNKSTSSHDTGFGISFTTSDKYIKGKNKQDIIQSKLVSKNGFLESNSNKVDTDTINKLNNIFEKYVPDAPKMFQDNITNAELIDNINKASNMIANYEDDNNLGRKSWVEFYKALNKDGYIKQYADGEKEAVVVSKENIKNIKPSTQAETKKGDEVLKIDTNLDAPKELLTKDSKTAEVLKDSEVDADVNKVKTKFGTSKILTNFVSEWFPYEKIARKTKNTNLLPTLNNMKNANAQTEFNINFKQRDINGNIVGKGVNEIFKPIEKSNLTHEFGVYMYMNRQATKAKGTADVFGTNVTSEQAKTFIKEMERKHPEFKNYKQDVLKYEKNLRNDMVSSGLISEKTSDYLEELYPDYVRIYRDVNKTDDPIIVKDDGKIIVANPIKRAKGGTQDIIPLKQALINQTAEIKKSTTKNMFGKELYKSVGGTKVEYKGKIDDVLTFKDGQNAMIFYDNGEQYMVPLSKDMTNIFNKPSEETMLEKIPSKLSRVQRDLITNLNSIFAITNVAKDLGDAVINTKYPSTFLPMYAKAWANMLSNSSEWKTYNAMGGRTVSYFDNVNVKNNKSLVSKIVRSPISAIEYVGDHLEQVTRYAEYLNTKAHGGSNIEAVYNAAEVTVNFKKGGTISKRLSKVGANYLNASVLGTYKAYENIANSRGFTGFLKLGAQATMLSIVPAVINQLIYDDDDDYEKLDDETKDKNFLYKIPGTHKFVKIPKGRLSSVISTLPRRAAGEEKPNEIIKGYGKFVLDQIGPNNPITSNLIYPMMNVITNGNDAKNYFGSNIIPERYRSGGKTLEDQWKDAKVTSMGKGISKMAYKTFGWKISPFIVDYLYDQYGGIIADVTTPFMTDQADETNILKTKFVVDSITRNKYTNEAYELMDKYSMAANTNESLRYKYIYSKMTQTWDIYSEIRDIQSNKKLTDAQKRKQVEAKQNQINKISEEAVKNSQSKIKSFQRDGTKYKILSDYTYYYNEKYKKWYKVREYKKKN